MIRCTEFSSTRHRPTRSRCGRGGLGDGGADLDQAAKRIGSFEADAHRLRNVDEQRAADRHFAFKFLGDQPITPCRHFPGDRLGRVARQVIAQVEQFASRTGPQLPVLSRRGEQIRALEHGPLPFGVDQGRKHAKFGAGCVRNA